MPIVPTEFPVSPPQVFALATPAHLLRKLWWENRSFREQLRRPETVIFKNIESAYVAFNVAITAWHMCDWVWHSWTEEQQKTVMNELAPGAAVGIGEFRGAVSSTSRELKICHQIANGSKHMKVSRADQSIAVGFKWQMPLESDEENVDHYKCKLVVLDNGTERDALDVFEKVFEFWERRLADWGFIDGSIIMGRPIPNQL